MSLPDPKSSGSNSNACNISEAMHLHANSGQPPDLVSNVIDGYGNSASPTYISIVQGDCFAQGAPQYPYKTYWGPVYVVSSATFSDPSNPGGTYEQWHFYAGSQMNLQGRGFAGFHTHQIQDSRNNVYETWAYAQAFPFTGMLVAHYATQSNLSSETLFNESLSTAETVLNSTLGSSRYFPYISNDTLTNYEVGGPKSYQLIKTTSTNYTFDDYGNATTVTRTVTDNDSASPASPYNGESWITTVTNTSDANLSTWCLNLFTETQVTYTASIGSSVTRTKQLTPDTTNCRYTQIVTEPGSSSYQVTEAFGFDSFGNIDSDTITGTGMTARVTSANWGTTGQFPMSSTDASGATTQFNYNFSYGVPNSVTDPNGVSVGWIYDGFARKVQETRPDGTFTQLAYNDCTVVGNCPLGNSHTLALTHSVFNTDSSVETDGTTLFDALQRPLIANKRMLANGTYDRNEVRYDNLGRIVQQAAPCAFTTLAAACPYTATIQYDVLNRPTQIQRPISASNSSLETTVYTYEGRTTLVTDPQNNAQTRVNDVNGWLRQTMDPYGYAVTTTYDGAGSRTGVTDNLGNTLWGGSYAYGIQPFLVASTDMDLGAWTYKVDALGERTAWQDAKGQSFSATYDALSRPLTRTEPDLFTQWTWGASASSRNVGKLQSVCTGTGGTCTSLGLLGERDL